MAQLRRIRRKRFVRNQPPPQPTNQPHQQPQHQPSPPSPKPLNPCRPTSETNEAKWPATATVTPEVHPPTTPTHPETEKWAAPAFIPSGVFTPTPPDVHPPTTPTHPETEKWAAPAIIPSGVSTPTPTRTPQLNETDANDERAAAASIPPGALPPTTTKSLLHATIHTPTHTTNVNTPLHSTHTHKSHHYHNPITASPLQYNFPQTLHYPLDDPSTPLSPIPILFRKPLFVNTHLPNPISPINLPNTHPPPYD